MRQKTKLKIQAEVFWAYTRAGAFQRARIYVSGASKEVKDSFRKSLKDFLYREVFLKYKGKKILEKELYSIIECLIKENKGNKCLEKKRLQFGNAQKFVNLYLKCMWVSGFGKMPPHFPVDRIVINELKLHINWTDMRKAKYNVVIRKAKDLIKNNLHYESVAIWEAVFYQEKYLNLRS